jgi:hypothetical protein
VDHFFIVAELRQLLSEIFHMGIDDSIADDTLIGIAQIHQLIARKDTTWLGTIPK